MSLYIGIDIGTSGVRACAIDDEEVEHGRASCRLPAPERQGPAVSQRAELWWDAVLLTLNDLLAQLDCRRVRAIAVDGTSGTLLLTDAHGAPLGPALAYNDTSTAEQLRRIEEVASTSSAAQGPGSALAKLLLLQERYPAARHALHQADWIMGCLTSRYGFSDENNALKLGYDPDALAPRLHPQCSTDLNYYPLPHDGERFPINDPNMPSRTSPRPDDDVRFFQGLLEGIASVERAAYRRLETLGAPYPTTVRTVGGGASNSAWTEIRARYLRVPVQSCSGREAAYGTALLARRGAGQG